MATVGMVSGVMALALGVFAFLMAGYALLSLNRVTKSDRDSRN